MNHANERFLNTPFLPATLEKCFRLPGLSRSSLLIHLLYIEQTQVQGEENYMVQTTQFFLPTLDLENNEFFFKTITVIFIVLGVPYEASSQP